MGRPPLRKKGAFTAAERQARRRKRLRKTRSAVLNRQRARKARDQQAEQYIPYPPGITYWRKVTLRAGETTEIMRSKTQPLPSIAGDLEDDEIRSLLEQITKLARKRGLL